MSNVRRYTVKKYSMWYNCHIHSINYSWTMRMSNREVYMKPEEPLNSAQCTVNTAVTCAPYWGRKMYLTQHGRCRGNRTIDHGTGQEATLIKLYFSLRCTEGCTSALISTHTPSHKTTFILQEIFTCITLRFNNCLLFLAFLSSQKHSVTFWWNQRLTL